MVIAGNDARRENDLLLFAKLGAELNANLGADPTCALTYQGNRRPPRRAAPPVGVRVDRVVRALGS